LIVTLQFNVHQRFAQLEQYVVMAEQMQAIEGRLFEAGMPVAALMDKVGGLIAGRFQQLYPLESYRQVGVLVGPGHNGGDALVVARELTEAGYQVLRYEPFQRYKDLTSAHRRYADHLGIDAVSDGADLQTCDVIVDGLFGFGLGRPLEGAIAQLVHQVNGWTLPIVSIDMPSGVHTDTGQILGTAIQATHTFCLGLWKQGLLQDAALDQVGDAELIDFGIPLADIRAVVGHPPGRLRITPASALDGLPIPRPPSTHKYREGHLLLVSGSRTYSGAAILAGLAARSSGVGMLTIAVPQSLAERVVCLIPDALVVGCEETDDGAIAHLPAQIHPDAYHAIACGPGMTLQGSDVVHQCLDWDCPVLVDADGLNSLAAHQSVPRLQQRSSSTVLTPHPGEFKRLFPDCVEQGDRFAMAQAAAHYSQSIVLLKGARTVVASPEGHLWVNPHSTAALARGGSGDVLTGLLGGLMAQAVARGRSLDAVVPAAVWWHAQGAIAAAHENTELGVDASTLITYLKPALKCYMDA
jgi:NAD(P)H-hydrate epimerase